MVIGPADTRVRERIARFPIDSKLSWSIPAFADEATVCINFAGGASSEKLQKNAATLGIANTWTIGMWVQTNSWTATNPDTLLERGGGGANGIRIVAANGGSDFKITLRDSAGTEFKNYEYTGLLSLSYSAWDFLVITFESGTLNIYKNGTYVAPSAVVTDTTGTMTDTSLAFSVGNWVADNSRAYNGNIFTVGIWDVILDTTAMGVLYNQGVGFRVDWNRAYGTDYTNHTDLQHWWRLGHDALDIGKDSGNGTAYDIMDDSNNIDGTDISNTYPGA